MTEFNTDFKTFKDARERLRPIHQIADNLENIKTVSGSKAYHFAGNYYLSVQYQAKLGVPGAQTIYEDLKKLFEIKSDD